MGRIKTVWATATDASRKASLLLSVWDTAERTGIEIEADGSAAMLGFYGGTPVAKQNLASSPTAAQIATVLSNLGLVNLT
jgi:hypothetical protein